MKITTAVATLFLLVGTQAAIVSAAQAKPPVAIEVDFIQDEGCDSSVVFTKGFRATGECVRYNPKGTLGAQIVNVLKHNVNFSLYSDTRCTPSKAVFVDGQIVQPGGGGCYADSGGIAKSVIVSNA